MKMNIIIVQDCDKKHSGRSRQFESSAESLLSVAAPRGKRRDNKILANHRDPRITVAPLAIDRKINQGRSIVGKWSPRQTGALGLTHLELLRNGESNSRTFTASERSESRAVFNSLVKE